MPLALLEEWSHLNSLGGKGGKSIRAACFDMVLLLRTRYNICSPACITTRHMGMIGQNMFRFTETSLQNKVSQAFTSNIKLKAKQCEARRSNTT